MKTDDEKKNLACLLCGHNGLTSIPKAPSLLGVTSDDRLWNCSGSILVCTHCGHAQKMNDEDWQQNATEVYSEYALYQSSGGDEHVIFNGPVPKPRSHLLLTRLRDQIDIPVTGRMLDVGCGNGPLLRSFGAMFPEWNLVGFEPSDQYRADVQEISGVELFCSGSLEQVPGHFDLIALYYVLEHIPDPAQVVEELRAKLKPGGLLVIVVPHYLENPFDLLVVDHCSHFRTDTLSSFLTSSGFDVLDVSTEWIPRAVACVARNVELKSLASDIKLKENVVLETQSNLKWLNQVAEDATFYSEKGVFGIFGTATAGSWLTGVVGDNMKFFIDEDPARTGRENTHLGRPVYSPEDAPPHDTIYISLPPVLAKDIFNRLQSKFPNLKLVLPPML